VETISRRRFIETTAATAALAAVAPSTLAFAQASGFRGTLCFFSKHLPRLDGRGLARVLGPLGFAGVDLTVRPKGHVEPARVVEDLPVFVKAIRQEGLVVPMITTDLTSAADPAAVPTLQTAASLKIPFFKPGYYHYAFKDVRAEVAVAAEKVRNLAALSARHGVHLGFHNHSGYIGGNIWDIADTIDSLPAKSAGYYFDIRHAVVEGGYGG
jgi:L-ribulose-5-phosphate 3-epimerase